MSARCRDSNMDQDDMDFIEEKVANGIPKSLLVREAIKTYRKLEEGKLYDKQTILDIINSDRFKEKYKENIPKRSGSKRSESERGKPERPKKKRSTDTKKIRDQDILNLFDEEVDPLKGT